MDVDKDEIVSDKEWINFFNYFIDIFQECDKDWDWFLNIEEATACINGNFSLLNSYWLIYLSPNFNLINFNLNFYQIL